MERAVVVERSVAVPPTAAVSVALYKVSLQSCGVVRRFGISLHVECPLAILSAERSVSKQLHSCSAPLQALLQSFQLRAPTTARLEPKEAMRLERLGSANAQPLRLFCRQVDVPPPSQQRASVIQPNVDKYTSATAFPGSSWLGVQHARRSADNRSYERAGRPECARMNGKMAIVSTKHCTARHAHKC